MNPPNARRLARRYGGQDEPLDGLAQVAALAPVKAIDGYDAFPRCRYRDCSGSHWTTCGWL
jgi:RNA polymerase sigma-B factor